MQLDVNYDGQVMPSIRNQFVSFALGRELPCSSKIKYEKTKVHKKANTIKEREKRAAILIILMDDVRKESQSRCPLMLETDA